MLLLLLILLLINIINGFILLPTTPTIEPPQQTLDTHDQQYEYKIRLSRNDLNKEQNLIKFKLKNEEEEECYYEIIKLCTKTKNQNQQNLECSFNKFKFLPFLIDENKLLTKENKINFQNIDLFELNISIGNCRKKSIEAAAALVDYNVESIETIESNSNNIKLTILLVDEDLDKNLEVNIISASNDYEILFDNLTQIYQIFINKTSYLSEQTVLAYVLVNIIDIDVDYQFKFQIIPSSDENVYHNSLNLVYDEMKSGLYSIKTKQSFNLTQDIGYLAFNYDFYLLVNGKVNQVKKFQIKFDNSQYPVISTMSIDNIEQAEMNNNTTTITIDDDDESTTSATTKSMLKSIANSTISLYNIVIIIISITIVLIIVIFFICICLLMMYLCKRYKGSSSSSSSSNGGYRGKKSNSKEQIIKVNSESKLNQITSISSSITTSSSSSRSSTQSEEIDDSTASCISAKAISTYNLNKANIRYEKPLKMQQQQQQQQEDNSSLSISPITTATTLTSINNTTALSNSSLLTVVDRQQQISKLISPSSIANSDYHHQKYLKLLNHNESYGFYSLKNKNIFENQQQPVDKIYVCNLNNDEQISSV